MKTRRPAPSPSPPANQAAAPAAARPAPGLGARGDFLGATVQRKDALPEGLRNSLETLSGISLDHVKVRYNSKSPDQVGAHAYTKGSEIHLARGQEQHLAHEAWHVVQQARRRVRPTGQVAGQPLNDDHRLEREADLMGAKAERMASSSRPSTEPVSAPMAAPAPLSGAIQRVDWATDQLRKEAQERPSPYATPEYTLHHKVSRDRLGRLARWAAQNNSAGSAAFQQTLAKVTHQSARGLVALSTAPPAGREAVFQTQLDNMPMNIEYGPKEAFRISDPGSGFDPNTEPVEPTAPALSSADSGAATTGSSMQPAATPGGAPASSAAAPTMAASSASATLDDSLEAAPPSLQRQMTGRSHHLAILDALIQNHQTGEPPWAEMTKALENAHQFHTGVHQADGHLSAPLIEQWRTVGPENANKHHRYERLGEEFSRPDLGSEGARSSAAFDAPGMIKAQKDAEKASAERQRRRDEHEADRLRQHIVLRQALKTSPMKKDEVSALMDLTDMKGSEKNEFLAYLGADKKAKAARNGPAPDKVAKLLAALGRSHPRQGDPASAASPSAATSSGSAASPGPAAAPPSSVSAPTPVSASASAPPPSTATATTAGAAHDSEEESEA